MTLDGDAGRLARCFGSGDAARIGPGGVQPSLGAGLLPASGGNVITTAIRAAATVSATRPCRLPSRPNQPRVQSSAARGLRTARAGRGVEPPGDRPAIRDVVDQLGDVGVVEPLIVHGTPGRFGRSSGGSVVAVAKARRGHRGRRGDRPALQPPADRGVRSGQRRAHRPAADPRGPCQPARSRSRRSAQDQRRQDLVLHLVGVLLGPRHADPAPLLRLRLRADRHVPGDQQRDGRLDAVPPHAAIRRRFEAQGWPPRRPSRAPHGTLCRPPPATTGLARTARGAPVNVNRSKTPTSPAGPRRRGRLDDAPVRLDAPAWREGVRSPRRAGSTPSRGWLARFGQAATAAVALTVAAALIAV